jgi:hypothetical protein
MGVVMAASRCRRCQRLNPAEAHYCHHDGYPLDSTKKLGPVAVSVQPFHAPFVFPSGRTCRSFDELVIACEDNWEEAKTVVQRKYLQRFFSALGRLDLAEATRQAARSTDADHALDELLNKLPNTVRIRPRAQVQPLEMNLGQLTCGSFRRFTVTIENLGMGLLHGCVSCPGTPWLSVGDAVGVAHRLFRCRQDTTLTVQVLGKALRAGTLKGTVLIETNVGTIEIPVGVQVPAVPFAEGVLAGATSPRQLAERARAAPKAAAILFASGAVAAWYATNGWTYPVQGPASSGLGAVQQFFEALGLVAPPRVEISTRALRFRGLPGVALEQVVQVHTVEKRPVFAHAVSSVPWLHTGRAILEGRKARIPLRVASVPALPGETLTGQVVVTANGNQRFTVAVTLVIPGRKTARESPVIDLADAVSPLSLVAVELPDPPIPIRAEYPWSFTVPQEPLLDAVPLPDPESPARDGDYRNKPPPRRRKPE